MTVPSDDALALEVLKAGYTGNAAVVQTAVRIAQYNGGNYYAYTGRAIVAVQQVGSTAEKAKLAGNVQQEVTGAQQAYQANKFAGITSIALWKRVGIGALGGALIISAFYLMVGKTAAEEL